MRINKDYTNTSVSFGEVCGWFDIKNVAKYGAKILLWLHLKMWAAWGHKK